MLARPSRNETLEDILEQQQKFEAEKAKNPRFVAASAVKVTNSDSAKKSVFARSRQVNKHEAQKDEVGTEEKMDGIEEHSSTKIVFGDILERTSAPIAVRQRNSERLKKSLFAKGLHLNKDSVELKSAMEPEINEEESYIEEKNMGFDADEFLKNMSKEEILEAQKELMTTLDPALLSYLKHKPKAKEAIKAKKRVPSIENMEISSLGENNSAAQLLQLENSDKWVHFNKVEREKLEWLSDIPKNVPKLKPGEKYEARFDWKGVLLLHSVDLQESELYLHGDEPQRPGYTLQELFRLARSDILQQRSAAFSAIGSLLSIYQQGFYDQVLQLPVSKTFFLLRLGFDENVMIILEVVGHALSQLFYNEMDEHVLDLIYENAQGYWQPTLAVTEQNVADDEEDELHTVANLQQQIFRLLVQKGEKSTPAAYFNTDTEEKMDTQVMTDFHLAETDLIACLLRTNILERIR